MDLAQYKKMLEAKLDEATNATPEDAPFGMTAEEGDSWNKGRATAYQFALEMLPTE